MQRTEPQKDTAVSELVRRFVLTIVALAVLGVALIGLDFKMEADVADAARWINFAGKMRFQSQQIVLRAQTLVETQGIRSTDRARAALTSFIDRFERIHRAYTEGDPDLGLPPVDSPAIAAMLSGPAGNLDEQLRMFIVRARGLAARPDEELHWTDADLAYLSRTGPGVLLRSLDAAVDLHEAAATAKSLRALAIQIASVVVMVMAMVLAGLFLFRPSAERIREEIKARTSAERQLAVIFKSISAAVIVLDRRAIVAEANPAATALLGHARDDLVGRPIGSVFAEEEEEEEEEEVFVAHILSMVDADLQGRHDRDPATFWAAVAVAPVGLLAVAADGAIRSANAAAARLLGWPPDELAGRSIEDLVPAASRDAHRRMRDGFAAAPAARRMGGDRLLMALRRDGAEIAVEIGLFPLRMAGEDLVLAGLRTPHDRTWPDFRRTPFGRLFVEEEEEEEEEEEAFWAVERTVAARDGRHIPVLVSGAVTRDAGGAITGAVLSLRDMTAHRRASQMSARLGRLQAVDELAGGISHEFGNRLGTVKNLLVALRRDLDAAGRTTAERTRWRQLVEDAEKSVMDSAELARSLVTFARRQRLAPRAQDIDATIEAIGPVLAQAAGPRATIETDLSGPALPVEIDRAGFDSALLNLALNARDAMPRGGVLTIATGRAHVSAERARRRGVAPGDYARVAVRDTGTGMPADVVARAFDPFFTTKEVGRGTGLGLPMVRGFAEASGGFVEIESELGKGTTVTLYLPLKGPGEERPAGGDEGVPDNPA